MLGNRTEGKQYHNIGTVVATVASKKGRHLSGAECGMEVEKVQ
jgi:hypothetical protein